MLKENDNNLKRSIIMFGFILITTILLAFCFPFSSVNAEIIPIEEGQQIEFRAVELKEVGETKQLIVEVWMKNLNFQVIDIRLQHETFLKPSSISENKIIDINNTEIIPENFSYVNGFENFLDLTTMGAEVDSEETTEGSTEETTEETTEESTEETAEETTEESTEETIETEELRLVFSVMGSDELLGSNDYLHKSEEGLYYATITGEVLVGKLSFQVGEGEITDKSIKLKPKKTDPTTGIEVFINEQDIHNDENLFIFTLALASDDAYLSNLIISRGEINEENPEESTYKEYTLNPTFEKEKTDYEITILEYIDTLNITATQNHEKATMKIKVPKRNENNELVYDETGETIIYEEKELIDKTPLEITLNKLGEADTILNIEVTAESGKVTNPYKVVIKRPYGTIKGQIYTEPTKNTTQKSEANVKIYNSDETKEIINWEEAKTNPSTATGDEVNKKLNEMTAIGGIYKTNDDGTYEIKLIPGKYDILIDKAGYLDQIYINVQVENETTQDLGYKALIAGDVNKDGLVEILDKVVLTKLNGKSSIDIDFNQACDFNEDETIEILDKTVITKNNGQKRIIVDYEGGN